MAIDLNINPYYDDFDEFKNFHQILFRPGYAVQARELTQLQSIINDQIKKFGNHIFQQGSVVIPGNSFADLNTPYVKMQTSFEGQELIGSQFVGRTLVSDSTGVRAIVRAAEAATSTDPLTFYVTYLSGGGTEGEFSVFQASDELYDEADPTVRALVATTAPTGFGSLAFVKTGVFFVNGRFVTVQDSTTVISKYTSTPSARVLLQIKEEIVTSNEDDTLLDPASGSFNFAAPGADRYRLFLELTSLPLSAELDENYIEIMRYNAGVLEEHARYPKYSELEKSLARRTYDESGDYVVGGFKLELNEHLKTKYNDGVFEDTAGGDRDKFVYRVEPGKAYIRGFEVEKIAQTLVVADKARTSDHVKIRDYIAQPLYGQYIFVTNLVGLPNFRQRETVTLMSASVGGTSIGTMNVYAIDLLEGDATGQNAVYKLYYHDATLTGTNKLKDVGGITFTAGAGSAKVLSKLNFVGINQDFKDVEDEPDNVTLNSVGNVRIAKVHRFVRADSTLFVYRHDATKAIPVEGDFVTGGSTGSATVTAVTSSVQQGQAPLVEVNVDSLKSIKNLASTYADLEYYVWTNVNVTTDSSGNGTASISNGTFVAPDTGIIVAAGPSGTVSPSKISLLSPTVIKITAGPVSETVRILVQVKKAAVAPKSKVLTTATLSNVTPAQVISLAKCDIYDILSITDADGNDLTSSVRLDNGQRDFYYGVGSIRLNGALPSTNITIQFRYFEHTGGGDFFSVDSYNSLGADYISKVPSYRSTNTSRIYKLRNFLDFRPKVDDATGLFTSGGASLSDFPVVDVILSTPVQFYVPRVDSIVLNKKGVISLLSGEPAELPKKPPTPTDSIELYSTFVPAYTNLAKDVVANLSSTRRYTMKDIATLEKRVETVERLSMLNVEENSIVNTEVLDPITGLNRFKSGYLVDGFTNPFSIVDIDTVGNVSGFYGRKFGPKKEGYVADFSILPTTAPSGSTNIQITNGQITLPYTETSFINQPYSTVANFVTLNPFSAISWEGVLKVAPNFDLTVQSIDNSDNNIVTISSPPPPPPPPPPPDKPPPPPPPEDPKPPPPPPKPPDRPNPRLQVTVQYNPVEGSEIVQGTSVNVQVNVKNGKEWTERGEQLRLAYQATIAKVNNNSSTTVFNGFNLVGNQALYDGYLLYNLLPYVTSDDVDFSFNIKVNDLLVTQEGQDLELNITITTKNYNIAPGGAGEAFGGLVVLAGGDQSYVGGRFSGASFTVTLPGGTTRTPVKPYFSTERVKEGESFQLIFVGDVNNPTASTPAFAGRTVSWIIKNVAGTGNEAADFTTPVSGSITLTGNPATDRVTLTAKNDSLKDGDEIFQGVVVEAGAQPGVQYSTVTTRNVLVLDTSYDGQPIEMVAISVFARDLGLVDGLDSGVVNDTVVDIYVSKSDFDKITSAMNGVVTDAAVNPQGWADQVALLLLATTTVGSTAWEEAKQNAAYYLSGFGKTPSEVQNILNSAYEKAKKVLGKL